jgi:DNA invertase Pin-like site-specific DNA recombinase
MQSLSYFNFKESIKDYQLGLQQILMSGGNLKKIAHDTVVVWRVKRLSSGGEKPRLAIEKIKK